MPPRLLTVSTAFTKSKATPRGNWFTGHWPSSAADSKSSIGTRAMPSGLESVQAHVDRSILRSVIRERPFLIGTESVQAHVDRSILLSVIRERPFLIGTESVQAHVDRSIILSVIRERLALIGYRLSVVFGHYLGG
eukprot:scaffold992_cov118-Isochrysis_galbana.AAC.3